VPKALERAGIQWKDLGLIEIHEAFASQVLSNLQGFAAKGWEINEDIINVMADRSRSAIRSGHGRPAGDHAFQRDARRDVQFGLISVCAQGAWIRHGTGAPLVSTIARAPARSAPAVTWDVTDGIATVVLDLKASRSTSFRGRQDEFLACFAALADDAHVRAVAFFSGKPDNFIAGADIEEFLRLSSAAEAERLSADGQEMLERMARFPKPIAVAFTARVSAATRVRPRLHYRVATDHPKTQIGLPEVQLGIIPAAGGCQRLPRLIGLRAALDIILAGKTERAFKAVPPRIVDELVPPPILPAVNARCGAGAWPAAGAPSESVRRIRGFLLDSNPLAGGSCSAWRASRYSSSRRVTIRLPLAGSNRRSTAPTRLAEGLKRKLSCVPLASRRLPQARQISLRRISSRKDPASTRAPALRGAAASASSVRFHGLRHPGTAVVQAGVDSGMKDADVGRVAQAFSRRRHPR